jgi:tetratricopeptide (TPR) repeat protein
MEKLASEFPNNPKHLHSLSYERQNLGLLLDRKMEFRDAENEFRQAMALNEKAVANFPKTVQFRAGLGECQIRLARLLRDTGRLQEAELLFRKAIETWEKLVGEAPGRLNYPDLLFDTCGELARLLVTEGKLQEAQPFYRRLLELKPQDAGALNNVAWSFVTSPDPESRNQAWAVELAAKAVELAPKQGAYWNTLALAKYRAGEWKAALASLEKSMELRKGGDAFDWFILAMAHWKLDLKDDARKWYDKGALGMEKNKSGNNDLRRFRAEAEELLKIENRQARPDLN